jgi:hypothetical protein
MHRQEDLDFPKLQKSINPLVLSGRYDQALRECMDFRRSQKNNALLSLLIGQLHHRAGNSQEAKRFHDMAQKHANGDSEILKNVELFRQVSVLLPTSRTDPANFSRPDIVLLQAPGWGVNTPPLATAMLTSFARKKGFKVLPIDLNIEFYRSRPPKFDNIWELEQSLWFWETSE